MLKELMENIICEERTYIIRHEDRGKWYDSDEGTVEELVGEFSYEL